MRILLVFAAALTAVFPAARGAEVVMNTTLGEIAIKLLSDRAPETAANFRHYAESGFFDGLIFHRVIPGFVIQGGGFAPGVACGSTPKAATRPPLPNEADNGLKNLKYTLSMARTNDPHSATSQFFINLQNNVPLDHITKTPRGWGYAVFGKVVRGQEVVDKIAAVKTGSACPGQYDDVPVSPVVIEKAAYRD